MDSLPIAPAEPALATIRSLLLQARNLLVENPAKAERCIESAVHLLPEAAAQDAETAPAPATRAGGLASWQILRVQTLVETELDARIHAAELAEAVHLSASHFARAFKRSFGVSPHAYVNRRRIARAKCLMRRTPDSLTAIAFACGLADQAHFCRLFRQFEGQAPSAWRRSHADTDQTVALAA